MIISAVDNEDAIMIVIDTKAIRILELAWLVVFLAEPGHERAPIIRREYLHSIVVAIGDEQETSMMVERHASRIGELDLSIAMFLGANRELDSGISIKRTASHLFQVSLSHNNKEMFQVVKQEWR